MKKICFIIISAFVLLISCKKIENSNNNMYPPYNYEVSPDITNYKITLSGNRISQYSRFVNGVLQETTSFVFNDSTVDKIINSISPSYTAYTHYTLGNDGYATSSVDSLFMNDTLQSSANSTYEYSNGFLIKATTYYIHYLPQIDTWFNANTYTIIDDNISQKEITWGCVDEFSYYEYPDHLDVRYFSNGITGKSSKNLVSHAEWLLYCPCGPGSMNGYSDFKYFFDGNNRISKMIETMVPCHPNSGSEELETRYIYTTTYEYL
jgi:hypothetical protein